MPPSKLLPSSTSLPASTTLPLHSGFKRSVCNPQACILHLPHTKTHTHGEDIVIVDQDEPINPILLLKSQIRINDIPKDGFLFSYRDANILITLTKSLFLDRCNNIWHSLGHPHFTGHSFHIGGTTELLIAGIPPDVVRVTGRWSSESFLHYWRSSEEIAPHYITNLPTLSKRQNRYALSRSRGYPAAGLSPSWG